MIDTLIGKELGDLMSNQADKNNFYTHTSLQIESKRDF